uniref:Rhoptry associated protein-1 n=1 Tax=Babesia caballi TaxID=5871 RepID=D5I3P9_BABCB|nr:rhoptry associated protein-1 [Babesia caballi]
MRCSAGSVFGALLLVARGALAIRHNSRVAIMTPNDTLGDVTKSLLAASENVNAVAEASRINSDMSAYLSTVSDSFVESVCSKAPENSNCVASVGTYMNRCANLDCLTIDNLKYPVEAKYQPLTLPDPYQLHAAFVAFKNSDANPAKTVVTRFWMRFRSGKNHSYYHDFVFNLLEKNVTSDPNATDIENFVSKYLYMTTVYYRTYTNVDKLGARFFDKLSFTTGLFGWGIKKALKRIIQSNLPIDLGTYSISRLEHITSSYKDYMDTQIPVMSKFAERFSRMVVKRLLVTVAAYVDTPSYKKWYMKLKDFMLQKIIRPTAKFFKQGVYTPTKDFFQNKVGRPTKDFFQNKVGRPTKDFFQNKVGRPTKDFFQNKVGRPTKDFFRKAFGRPLRRLRNGTVAENDDDEIMPAVNESMDAENEIESKESMSGDSVSTELPSEESGDDVASPVDSDEERVVSGIQQPTLEEVSRIPLPADDDSEELQGTYNYESALS